jgi:hypothetical protein
MYTKLNVINLLNLMNYIALYKYVLITTILLSNLVYKLFLFINFYFCYIQFYQFFYDRLIKLPHEFVLF